MDSFEEKLISEVRKHAYLFNKKLIEYRNMDKKARAWHSIAESTQQPVEACKSRWKTLRDRFVKEFSKKPSGSEANDESKWVYFESMHFLKDFVSPRRTSTNFKENLEEHSSSFSWPVELPGESDSSGNIALEPPSPLASPSPLPSLSPAPSSKNSSKTRKRKGDSLDEVNERFKDFLGKMETVVERRFPARNLNAPFLEMVDNKLNILPENIRENAKMQILNYLHEQVQQCEKSHT